jgi:hypothetical protein
VTYKTVVITRADLYALVWAEPAMNVAARYGITGTGLAKICKRLRVPVPSRGYWARKQAGKAVRADPLPAPIRGQEMEHRFQRWTTPEAEYLLRDEVRAEIEEALAKAEVVERRENLEGAHALVAESLPLLQSASDVGSLRRERRCLAVSVEPDQLKRALAFLDVLFRTLEKAGFAVEATEPKTIDRQDGRATTFDALPGETRAKRGEEAVGLELVDHRWTWGGKETKGLKLHLTEAEDGVTPDSWYDTTTRTLEMQTRDVVRLIISNILVKEAKARGRREQEEAEQRRLEEKARAERESAMAADLQARVAAWREAADIRSLLAEVARRRQEGLPAPDQRWSESAERRAAVLADLALRPEG